MQSRHFLISLAVAGAIAATTARVAAPQNQPDIRVNVEMVQLNVAVTDSKGNYVTGLRPSDFQVAEDGISQKMAMFAVGNEAPRKLADLPSSVGTVQPAVRAATPDVPTTGAPNPGNVTAEEASDAMISPLAGADVFILFDTSNYMYRGFVFAQ